MRLAGVQAGCAADATGVVGPTATQLVLDPLRPLVIMASFRQSLKKKD